MKILKRDRNKSVKLIEFIQEFANAEMWFYLFLIFTGVAIVLLICLLFTCLWNNPRRGQASFDSIQSNDVHELKRFRPNTCNIQTQTSVDYYDDSNESIYEHVYEEIQEQKPINIEPLEQTKSTSNELAPALPVRQYYNYKEFYNDYQNVA